MTEEPRPEILPVETEREILFGRLVSSLSSTSLNPDLTVAGGWHIIAGTAVAGVLRQLQVMSARQLAVLLADEANRHEGWVIQEPPRYTAEEIDDAR